MPYSKEVFYSEAQNKENSNCLVSRSQDHRKVEFGKDILGLSSLTHMFKLDYPGQVAQTVSTAAFEEKKKGN